MKCNPPLVQLCAALLLIVLSGCQFVPSPTTKPVTTNDVIGTWSFSEIIPKATVVMTFKPTGVFTQEVSSGGQTNVYVGTWSLRGPYLDLTDFAEWSSLLPGWKAAATTWWMVDGPKRLEIFGGACPDPDAYHPLEYLGPAS